MFLIKFGVWVLESWVFGVKNGVKIVTACANGGKMVISNHS